MSTGTPAIYPSDASGPLELGAIDPDALVDFLFDWTDWLAGDSISSITVGVTDCALSSSSFTGTTATVWVDSAAEGKRPEIRVRVTTAGGRTDDRTVRLRTSQR